MYHGTTLEHIKARVLTEFSKTDSSICVIVTTCALGLGVDIKNITCIYHFGLPGDIEAIDQNLYLLHIFLIVNWLDKHMKDYALNRTLCRR